MRLDGATQIADNSSRTETLKKNDGSSVDL